MSNPRESTVRQRLSPRHRSAGFSLIELLVAVMLAIFLLGGLFAIDICPKRAAGAALGAAVLGGTGAM